MLNMQIKGTLAQASNLLKQNKINSPELDAEVLLAHSLKKDKEYLALNFNKELTAKQEEKYQKYIQRRLNHEPIAYIIKHKEFYGLDFYTDKNVLIPRPETETLIQAVLDDIKETNNRQRKQLNINSPKANNRILNIIDVGCGSGAIILALAKNLSQENNKFYAVDISEKALAIAKKNAIRHKAVSKIKFIQSDLLDYFFKNHNFIKTDANNDFLITANLPYLSAQQMQELDEDLKYEPENALFGGTDGLKYYKKLIGQVAIFDKLKNKLSLSAPQISLYLEIDPDQPPAIAKIISNYWPKAELAIKQDLCGQDRVITVKL